MANSPHLASHESHESNIGQTHVDSHPDTLLERVPSRQTNAQVATGQTSSNLRRAAIAALFVAPIVATTPLTRALVDFAAPLLADVATASLDHAFAWRTVRDPHDVEVAVPEHATPFELEQLEDASPEPRPLHQRVTPPTSAPHRGVIVRKDAVVRAVRSGGRPSSVPAPASGARPAGLALVGVSRFGTGLHDNDILTSVGGTPATSEAAVIAVVAGAISQGAKVITGVVWRDEQRFDVAVEIPGPESFTPNRRKRRSVHE